jgi:hypothetical protein
MTLSIAGKYPWGIFKTAPGGPGPQGIIFLTDSRFTDNVTNEINDVGPKIFSLSNDVGLVYAGWVHGALECIKSFKNYLQVNSNKSTFEKIDNLQNIAREKYSQLQKGRTENSPLYFLIGIWGRYENSPDLYLLRNDSPFPFHAEIVDGLYAIGANESTRNLFHQKLDEYCKSGKVLNDNPLDWLNYCSVVLSNDIIVPQVSRYVGGLIQTAILSKNQFNWVTQAEFLGSSETWIITEREGDRWTQKRGSDIVQHTEPRYDPTFQGATKIF